MNFVPGQESGLEFRFVLLLLLVPGLLLELVLWLVIVFLSLSSLFLAQVDSEQLEMNALSVQ